MALKCICCFVRCFLRNLRKRLNSFLLSFSFFLIVVRLQSYSFYFYIFLFSEEQSLIPFPPLCSHHPLALAINQTNKVAQSLSLFPPSPEIEPKTTKRSNDDVRVPFCYDYNCCCRCRNQSLSPPASAAAAGGFCCVVVKSVRQWVY